MPIRVSIYFTLFIVFLTGCSKSNTTTSTINITWDNTVVPYAAVPVSKQVTKRVFAHILPWFESPSTNSGFWGQHWTGENKAGTGILDNPNNGQIASHYYPSIGPYASSDTNVIDYQLLLMKLSGIDGIFIDWPGTIGTNDLGQNLANSNVIISRLSKLGLKYAVVYEDQNLKGLSNEIAQAQTDMNYLKAHYFSDPNYEQVSGNPLLLDFGPQALNSASDWTSAFSVLTVKPAFFTLEFNQGAGTNATGQFAWVDQSNITNLNSFYSSNVGTKISAAYAGFNSIYAEEPPTPNAPTWIITPTVATFQQTVSLALDQPGNYLQLVTWNDYGEGTMIEPTTQFQYSFLTDLQQQLSVQSSLSVADLQAVTKLYTARVANTLTSPNPTNLSELDQIYYDIVSLKMDSAKALLQKDF
jgi:hypothetical protein